MIRDELIVAMARAAIIDTPHADVCLSVLCGRIPGLADVIEGKAVVVPREVTAEMIEALKPPEMNTGSRLTTFRNHYDAMLSANPYRMES